MTSRLLHSDTRRLAYGDTDAAGILYFATWFPRIEAVQSEFFFLQGLRQDTLQGRFGWSTIIRETRCEYLVPVMLFDEIRVEMRLASIGESSFRFEYTLVRTGDAAVVARAVNTVVTIAEGRAIRIPADLRVRLDEWSAVEEGS